MPNRHVKSIIRGRNTPVSWVMSHAFGVDVSVDEQMRPFTSGYECMYEPSYEHFRINHYLIQSFNYYRYIKQGMSTVDAIQDPNYKNNDWFNIHDRNECDDGIRYKFLIKLKLKIEEIKARIDMHAPSI